MRSSVVAVPREVGVPVWYRPADGLDTVADLADAATMRFDDVLPYRRLVSYKGQRNFVGSWWFETTGAYVSYESWVERDHVMLMDRAREVVQVLSQPFCVEVEVEGKAHKHVPDFFVRRADGHCRVVDVRPDARVAPADEALFTATREACSLVGWDYARVGEVEPLVRANVGWLAAYRHPRCGLLGTAWATLRSAIAEHSGVVRLGEVGALVGCENVAVLPHVYHRLWRGDLSCDESAPWSLEMPIRVGEER